MDLSHGILPRRKIGIMDSGYGGLSVVGDILSFTNQLDIVYFADFKNAPYGNQSKEEVRMHVEDSVKVLFNHGVESILLACNTATSVAVSYLRDLHREPIFGMEPAIKPAIQDSSGGNILVLATNLTLKEDRFLSLKNKVDPMNRIIPVPCPGLSTLIDESNWSGAVDYVRKIMDSDDYRSIHSIVLGCTHYVFLEDRLRQEFPDRHFFHGNLGTTKHLLQSLGIPFATQTILESSFPSDLSDRVQFLTNRDNQSSQDEALKFIKLRLHQNLTTRYELTNAK